jgi:SAM-dependent methyltransferase
MSSADVDRHYGRADLLDSILDGLRAAGISPEAPSVDDLAPVDHFHTRGREATLELLRLGGLRAGDAVLDLGGGLGGSARLLAREVGCHVTVLDLTEDYVRVGRELTRRTGLDDRVTFVRADALGTPFADASFEVVWTQHSSMNIPDKAALYGEVRRLLRPGGRLLLHEIVAGPVQPIHSPVPWAREPAVSHLRPPEEVRALLAGLGLREHAWDDQSAISLDFFRGRLAAVTAAAGPPPLGLHLLLGADFAAMFANQIRNLEESRIRIVMAAWEA